MRRVLLVIDLDGVVANTPKKMCQLYPEGDWSYNNFPQHIKALFQEPEFYLSLEPIPSSISFLLQWRGLIDFVFASTRPVPIEVSKEWLVRHGYFDPTVYHVDSLEGKYKLTAELKALGLVDDAPFHLIPTPFIRFIYSWPYNRQYSTTITRLFSDGRYQSIYRIHNLQDFDYPLKKYLRIGG